MPLISANWSRSLPLTGPNQEFSRPQNSHLFPWKRSPLIFALKNSRVSWSFLSFFLVMKRRFIHISQVTRGSEGISFQKMDYVIKGLFSILFWCQCNGWCDTSLINSFGSRNWKCSVLIGVNKVADISTRMLHIFVFNVNFNLKYLALVRRTKCMSKNILLQITGW